MDNQKQDVKVVVYEEDSPFIPESVTEFSEFWDNIFSKIPEEFREEATVELETLGGYDYQYLYVTVSYYREETDSEFQARLNKEQSKTCEVEALEREQLRFLQEKYGV